MVNPPDHAGACQEEMVFPRSGLFVPALSTCFCRLWYPAGPAPAQRRAARQRQRNAPSPACPLLSHVNKGSCGGSARRWAGRGHGGLTPSRGAETRAGGPATRQGPGETRAARLPRPPGFLTRLVPAPRKSRPAQEQQEGYEQDPPADRHDDARAHPAATARCHPAPTARVTAHAPASRAL